MNLKGYKFYTILTGIIALALVGIVLAGSLKNNKKNETVTVAQDISKAEFNNQQEFPLIAEQDDDTPFRILDVRSYLIPRTQYEMLTGLRTELQEVVSAPNITFQNVSDKTIVSVGIIINDKEAKTKFGMYIRQQSIKPGQNFVFRSENFVPVSENPAKNPKFWLTAKDKTKVVVRAVVYFDDGTMWVNRNHRSNNYAK